MNHKLDSTGKAAVAQDIFWLPIDEHTPRGQLMWLIKREAGVAVKGIITGNDKWFDHWSPLPKFKELT